MALSLVQQIYETLDKAKSILITFKKNLEGDSLASSLALSLALKKINQKVSLMVDSFNPPIQYSFLPAFNLVQGLLTSSRNFVISLDISKNSVEEFSYETERDKLNIFIKPKKGTFSSRDISSFQGSFNYDLIFILDTQDLESLGKIYEENTEFFFKTPIINIDHHPANENFGQINLVELKAAATSEIVFDLLSSFGQDFIDEDIATCLLTGLISKTKSFQLPQVTPQTLSRAGQLISLGARHEEIMNYLYRNKTLSSLRLWGRVLARLQSDLKRKLVWSLIPREDFIKSGTQEGDLAGVVEELIGNIPEAQIIVLFYEKGEAVSVRLRTSPNFDALNLTKIFSSQGSKNEASFILSNKTLLEVEKEVIEEIKSKLSSSLNIGII